MKKLSRSYKQLNLPMFCCCDPCRLAPPGGWFMQTGLSEAAPPSVKSVNHLARFCHRCHVHLPTLSAAQQRPAHPLSVGSGFFDWICVTPSLLPPLQGLPPDPTADRSVTYRPTCASDQIQSPGRPSIWGSEHWRKTSRGSPTAHVWNAVLTQLERDNKSTWDPYALARTFY